jgi:hypothetical protein
VEARAEILLDHRQRDVDDGHVEQQHRRKREPVGIDHPLQLVEARAEILLDHRQRDVDDGHVEQQHRRRRRYDAQRQPAPAGHAIVANAATRAIVP